MRVFDTPSDTFSPLPMFLNNTNAYPADGRRFAPICRRESHPNKVMAHIVAIAYDLHELLGWTRRKTKSMNPAVYNGRTHKESVAW